MPKWTRAARPLLLACVLATAVAAPWTAASAAPRAGSGVYYEIFVRSFYDSNRDGIGDLNGITDKLAYLKWLGVSGIWLTPINPSPSYHGYDVTHYFAVRRRYGTLASLRRLVRQAHARGIKVLMDLVVNHTSNRNPWFEKAIRPRSPYHDWYIWAGPHTNLNTPSIFDGDPWHAIDGEHYLGIFTGAMPDLNYRNPAVRHEVIRIGRFWLRQGVDGFRLDAAKHLFIKFASDRHNPHALANNIQWWREFHAAMAKIDPHVFLVGEVSAGHESGEAPYYAALNCVFNFPLAALLVHSAASENGTRVGPFLQRSARLFTRVAGHRAADCPFLSNHDQNRVLDQLSGNMNHLRMAAAMLLTLPGHPFIYYGEAIGMHGVKPDPHIREPMRWDRNPRAPGDTTWEPAPENASPALSVAAERAHPGSLLHWYRRLIHWRTVLSALRDGVPSAYPAAPALAAYVLADPQQRLLVVNNLSGRLHAVPLSGGFSRVILRSVRGARITGRRLVMPPYSTAILR